ncbi:MAG TPA: hypothetical protein VJ762_06575, partial [Sphingobium sp.]|nr:hypothetical protein [Sphingobium sp.]
MTPKSDGRRAVVLHPYLKRQVAEARRAPEARLEEAAGLARAIGLDIAHQEAVALDRLRPGSLIGDGKIAALK